MLEHVIKSLRRQNRQTKQNNDACRKKLKTFLSGSKKKRRPMKNSCEENYGFDQTSPIFTITVCTKGKNKKNLKKKKICRFLLVAMQRLAGIKLGSCWNLVISSPVLSLSLMVKLNYQAIIWFRILLFILKVSYVYYS